VLVRVISPPSRPTSSRLIETEAGAAVDAGGGAVALRERLEDPPLVLSSIPIPVSRREGDHRRGVSTSDCVSGLQPLSARADMTCTSPCSVNLNALASRFLRIWRRRWGR
jgi:hypothetical protein